MEKPKYVDKEHALRDAPKRLVRIESLSDELKKDRDVVLAVMKEWGEQYFCILKELKNDKEIALTTVTRYGQSLIYMSKKFKNDLDIVLAALKNNGMNLQYASKQLRDNYDIVMFSVTNNPHSYRFVSNRLKKDDKIIRKTLSKQGMCLELMSTDIRSNEDYFRLAMKANSAAFKYGIGDFVYKEEYIKKALTHSGNLCYMPESICDDYNIVKKEVSSIGGGKMLEYASLRFKDNKEIALAALKSDNSAFKFISQRLRNEKDVFLAASSFDEALTLTSEEIRSNSKLMIKALKRSMFVGYLEKANPIVFNDKLLLLEMFKKDLRNSLSIIPKEALEFLKNVEKENYIKFLEKYELNSKLESKLEKKDGINKGKLKI